MTTLSVVMPVYNEAEHLPATLDALVEAVERSSFEADLVLVDDGSTDGSAEAALGALAGRLPIRLVREQNRGRFWAVREGLESASAPTILILGARVRLRPGALAFVVAKQAAGERVWTGHVHIRLVGNPYGTFQNVLTEIAWRDYFDDPRPVTFGVQDFDRFPKGSGCFVAPRALLVAAYADTPTRYADVRHANDDTPMLRAIAAIEPIHLAPGFAADYEPRGALRTFFRHSSHRGTVFFDGHGRRESRFFPIAILSFPLTAISAIACLSRPKRAPRLAALTAGVAGLIAIRAGRSRSEILTVSTLAPVWATAFTLGLWRGLLLYAVNRVRRPAPGSSGGST